MSVKEKIMSVKKKIQSRDKAVVELRLAEIELKAALASTLAKNVEESEDFIVVADNEIVLAFYAERCDDIVEIEFHNPHDAVPQSSHVILWDNLK
jgi:hypothetical protein